MTVPGREQQVIEKAHELTKGGPLPAEAVGRIYQKLTEEMRNWEAKLGSGNALGLLLVVATAVGWGLGWPMMKIAMHDWPPLFARGCAGLAAALGLAIIAVVRA